MITEKDIEQFSAQCNEIFKQVARDVIGQKEVVEGTVVAMIAGGNGDYYDTANGIALGSVMSEGVFHNISGSYYALGFYDDGTAVMGKPNLRINAETDRGSTFGITAIRDSGCSNFFSSNVSM